MGHHSKVSFWDYAQDNGAAATFLIIFGVLGVLSVLAFIGSLIFASKAISSVSKTLSNPAVLQNLNLQQLLGSKSLPGVLGVSRSG